MLRIEPLRFDSACGTGIGPAAVIDRRKFIKISATAGAAVTFAPPIKAWPYTGVLAVEKPTNAPLTATGIKGSNIIPPRVDIGTGAAAWFNLWSRWDWAWIERSVRRAVEQGANTIRIIGDVNAVRTGTISESTYHERLEQLITLCAQSHCKLYYCVIDLRHKWDASPDFIAGFLGGVGSLLAQHDNILAMELCNEVATVYRRYPEAQVVDWIKTWSDAIRRNAPQIPLSISDISEGGLLEKIAAARYYDMYADAVDFFDIHIYDEIVFDLPEDSHIFTPYEVNVNRPLLIGEFGANRSKPDATPGRFYAQVRKLRDSSRLIVGALQWGAVNDDFGLYSESDDRLQLDIAPEWACF